MDIFPVRNLQYLSKPQLISEVNISPLLVKLEGVDIFQFHHEETSLKY